VEKGVAMGEKDALAIQLAAAAEKVLMLNKKQGSAAEEPREEAVWGLTAGARASVRMMQGLECRVLAAEERATAAEAERGLAMECVRERNDAMAALELSWIELERVSSRLELEVLDKRGSETERQRYTERIQRDAAQISCFHALIREDLAAAERGLESVERDLAQLDPKYLQFIDDGGGGCGGRGGGRGACGNGGKEGVCNGGVGGDVHGDGDGGTRDWVDLQLSSRLRLSSEQALGGFEQLERELRAELRTGLDISIFSNSFLYLVTVFYI